MTYNRISPFGVQHDLVSPGEEFRAQNERQAMQDHLRQLAMSAQMDALRGLSSGGGLSAPSPDTGGADIANSGQANPNYFGPAHETRNFDMALEAQKNMNADTLKNRLDVAGVQMGPSNREAAIEEQKFQAGQGDRDFHAAALRHLQELQSRMAQPQGGMPFMPDAGPVGMMAPGYQAGEVSPDQQDELAMAASMAGLNGAGFNPGEARLKRQALEAQTKELQLRQQEMEQAAADRATQRQANSLLSQDKIGEANALRGKQGLPVEYADINTLLADPELVAGTQALNQTIKSSGPSALKSAALAIGDFLNTTGTGATIDSGFNYHSPALEKYRADLTQQGNGAIMAQIRSLMDIAQRKGANPKAVLGLLMQNYPQLAQQLAQVQGGMK